MCRRWIIPIGIFCFTPFVLRYVALLASSNSQSSVVLAYFIQKDEVYNPGEFINLGFSRFQFEQVKLEESQLKQDYEVTAILLHWEQVDSLRKTLEHLRNTGLFKQIIVWNKDLIVQHLLNDSREFIGATDSEENLKTVAKYYACVEAKTNVCLHAEHHWQTMRYSKSLIASFRSNPRVIHSLTDAYTYFVSLTRKTSSDNTIGLHTDVVSCSDCGSVFSREYAQRSLHQLKTILSNRSESSSLSQTPFFTKSQHKDSDFRETPRYVRSPSLIGDLIFYSNVLPFEIRNTSLNISRADDVTHFLSHGTFKAVDGQLETCWHTSRHLRRGDFFAIDLLRAQSNITFTLTVSHNPNLQQNLRLRISFDGIMWISYRSLKGRFIKKRRTSHGSLHTFLFDSEQFALGFESFRYIGFEVTDSFDQRFQVCEIEIISKDDFHNIRRDFQAFN